MVAFRILTMLIAFKYLSNHFGVSGFGLLSQVMAIAALFSTFAGGGLSNGLIKEVAGALDQTEKVSWLKAGFAISLASAVMLFLVSIGLYLFGAKAVLGDSSLAWVFLLIGFAQILTGAGNTAQAYLSGIRDINSVALAGIMGAAFSVMLVVLGSYVFGLMGAVGACAIFALSPSLFSILFLSMKQPKCILSFRPIGFDIPRIKRLLRYSLAMIVTAAAVPLVLIYIRLRLSQAGGWEVVGHWQAVARIGDAYIQVFGTLFAIILLPRLAALSGSKNLQAMYGFIPPVMILFLLGGTVFWMFSPQILTLAYSADFTLSSNFVLPQLAADGLKILSSFFIYRFVALGRPQMQALGEIVQALTMFVTFIVLLPGFGGLAAVWSYVVGAGMVLVFAAVATAVDDSHRRVA